MLAPFTVRLARHRGLAIWLAVVVAVSGGSWWLGSRVRSPEQVVAEAEPPAAAPITATVQQRVLRQQLTLQGTVLPRHEERVEVDASSVQGRPVVTELPVSGDDEVQEGMLLAEVAGRPVFALYGEKPMYRTLRHGMEGEDVVQLQRALARLGYDTGGDDGIFGANTAAAVRQFYADRGYEAPARVLGSPESLAEPEPEEPGAAEPEPEESGAAEPEPRVTVPLGEVVYLSDFPARVSEVAAAVGDEVEGLLMTVATGGLIVEVPVTVTEKSKVEPGSTVRATAQTLGAGVSGKVARVARRDGTGQSEDEGRGRDDGSAGSVTGQGDSAAGYVAYVTIEEGLGPELRGRDVEVTVQVASTGGEVLVVPLAAVWSRPGGGSYVTVRGDDGGTRDVAVRLGMSAEGYVELSRVDGQLRSGDRVVVGKERTG